jgi:uncharacterized membrane protein YedE/YeeE
MKKVIYAIGCVGAAGNSFIGYCLSTGPDPLMPWYIVTAVFVNGVFFAGCFAGLIAYSINKFLQPDRFE